MPTSPSAGPKNDDQRKHLEMIQAVITRLAGNSFVIRGWSVTLVSALFALAAKDADRAFVVVSYFPCVLFWCLDAYYLSQERKFRSLYNSVRQASGTDYEMDTKNTAKPRDSWPRAFFSATTILFHGAIIVAISIVMLFLKR
jgi:hypothetical protein